MAIHSWVLVLLMTQGFSASSAYSSQSLWAIEGYRSQQLCDLAGNQWRSRAPKQAEPQFVCIPGP